MKILKIIFPLFLLTACIQTTILKNGYQKAPTNPKVYKNRKYFNQSLLSQIDTTVIYEEYNTSLSNEGKPVNVLARLNYKEPNTHYGAYKFYANGCYNLFHLDRNNHVLTKEMFDPTYTGWRGVFYKYKKGINGDLITQVSGMGAIGILTEHFEFKGDTLFAVIDKRNYVYIKRRIPHELLDFRAEW